MKRLRISQLMLLFSNYQSVLNDPEFKDVYFQKLWETVKFKVGSLWLINGRPVIIVKHPKKAVFQDTNKSLPKGVWSCEYISYRFVETDEVITANVKHLLYDLTIKPL